VRLLLVDSETKKPIGGMVRVYAEGSDEPLGLPNLLDRLRGLGKSEVRVGWQVVPVAGVETTLPPARLRLEAVAGLETALARRDLDLTAGANKGGGRREITVELPVLFRPGATGLAAGNTHLHLRNMTLAEADAYLKQIPPADQLRVLFISYLERFKDDRTYITNEYPIGEVKRLAGTGVLYNNGEEHRHNFQAFGPGYGHVMFLDIRELVRPVSLGPGITGAGHDDRPLGPGIAAARKQAGTVIWCHNDFGYEFLPHVLAGRLDALNVYDGSRSGTYADRYYRCLNAGLKLPISTGTDWFLYDFARVYAGVGDKPLTVASWLEALRAGRTVATNGPLLTLEVDGQPVGSTLKLEKPATVRVEAKAVGRHDFGKLQFVRNGEVIETAPAAKEGDRFVAQLRKPIRIDEPAWLAARIETVTRNEFDMPLFAHTSPVYVELGGNGVLRAEAVRELLRELEQARDTIRAKGSFSAEPARDAVLALYDDAARTLRERANRRGR
ncbi:MAG TPA: CehA/McbA family metallohydrolase, partial [Gemmataceae bacterium]